MLMKASPNVFIERFQQQLQSLSVKDLITAKRYVVAYSGGMDSHVLLHLCYQSKIASNISFRVIHINHGLQKEADKWTQHCSRVCEMLKIPFLNINVDAKSPQGESPENAARKARYDALVSELEEDECLLTAHHKDDQSETLLLQLFRGAGPAGLSSMPLVRRVGNATQARPLLEFSRDELLQYAKENKLEWIEDPSNQDTDFDRNFVRQKILPLIKGRWQQVDNSLAQVANQQQHALEIIESMAAIDLASIVTQQADVVSVNALQKLPQARQFNVLRFWIRRHGKDAPTANVLQQVVESVITAAEDAAPVVSWGQSEVRRYQNNLYLLEQNKHDDAITLSWNPRDILVLDDLGIELSVEMIGGQGLPSQLLDEQLKVRFRQGGEKIQPTGRKHTHSLKKLMQDAGVPPWMRSQIPLIYLEDELICVCGYWVSSKFSVDKDGWIPACRHPER